MKKLFGLFLALISFSAFATPEDSNDLLSDNSTTTTATQAPAATGSTSKNSQPKLIIVKQGASQQKEPNVAQHSSIKSNAKHKDAHNKHKKNTHQTAKTKKGKKAHKEEGKHHQKKHKKQVKKTQ